MRKKFRFKRSVQGVISLALAMVITFGVTPIIQNITSGQVEIIRVKTDIPSGSRIEATHIEQVTVGSYNLPPNVIKLNEQAIGKISLASLSAGDFLFPEKLSDTLVRQDTYLDELPEGKQAISVTVRSLAGGLSGKLQPGDIISVISLGAANEAEVRPELTYVKVLAATTGSGADKLTESKEADNQSTPQYAKQNTLETIILLADARQAKAIAEVEASNWVHISLVYRGSTEKSLKYLEVQDVYLQGLVEQDADDESKQADDATMHDGYSQDSRGNDVGIVNFNAQGENTLDEDTKDVESLDTYTLEVAP